VSEEPAASDAAETPIAAVIGIEPDNLTCFMGGAFAGEFTPSEDLAARLRDGQEYRVFDLAGEHDPVLAIGRARNEGSEGECNDLWRLDLALEPGRTGHAVALRRQTGPSPLPKVLEVVAEPNAEQRELLQTFLARRGIAKPAPQFDQIVRTDLDGDGIEEQILNVVRIGQDRARAGDHSVLMVTRGTGQSLRNFVIQDEVTAQDSEFSSTLWRNRIVAVVDIDGDGTAEIVTNGAYVYGGGWEVIRFDGSGFDYVLFCGCDG
jgi:hypothetical protein